MAGMIMDAVLMLLLVAAVGYGVKLERKLSALRAGQLAFAQAVTDLNAAAGRAENALATLRASGQETDLLHDRIIKAREVKAQLEALIARPGLVVRRETLEARVYGYDKFVNANSLESQISRLRTNLAKKTDRVKIQAIRGLGYRLSEH